LPMLIAFSFPLALFGFFATYEHNVGEQGRGTNEICVQYRVGVGVLGWETRLVLKVGERGW
jgi:hypothetical protein